MLLALRLSLVSLILVLVSFSPFSSVFEKSGTLISKVSQRTVFSLVQRAKEEISFFGGLHDLWVDNAGLSAEIMRLRGENARLQEAEQENALLREQLGVAASATELIAARVVGLASEQGNLVLVLDKGENDGVAVGSLVVLGNYLVGEVAEVEIGRSLVMLLSDSRFSVAALDQSSPSRSGGVVSGSFGTKLRMGMILPEEHIEAGDTVVSSGLDGRVPHGLVLGRITRVISSDNAILKEAELELLFTPSKLEEVFIRKSGN